MNKRVLYLSYDGMTDPLGQSQVIPYLGGLSAKGHQIWLISAEKNDAFVQHQQKISALLQQHNIHWFPIPYTKKPPILSTVIDIIRLRRKAKMLVKKNNIELVHCRSYITAFVGLHLKKKGIHFIFDMRGFWADERVDGNLWNLNHPIYRLVYRFFKRRERQFLTSADAVVSLTENAKKEMLQWNIPGLIPDKIYVIPCCADLDFFNYNQIENTISKKWRNKLNISPEIFVLSYLGSVGTWYLAEEMLAFYKELLTQKPESCFLFITKDSPDAIQHLASQQGIPLEKIRIQPAEREQVPELLTISNASIFFIKPAYSKKASSPTKLAELMGLGIPIIANSGVGDVESIILQNPLGILIHEFNSPAYGFALKELEQLHTTEKHKTRQLACEYFSLDRGIAIFDSIYQKLL
ncbi:MAG: glycosyltransferase [Salinivirgaceae bacterium]